MSKNFKFNSHIENTTNKAYSAMTHLYPVLKIQNGLNLTNKLKIYTSLIRPILTYAIPIWFNIPQRLHNKISVVERKCLRMAIDFKRQPPDYHFISNEELYEQTKIRKLEEFLKQLNLKCLNRTFGSSNPLINGLGRFDEIYIQNSRHKPPHFALYNLKKKIQIIIHYFI